MKSKMLLVVLLFCACVAADDFVCKKDVPYKENNCNTCTCQNDGLVCTRIMCYSKVNFQEQCKSTPGKKWNDNCNECICSSSYGQVCTDKKCSV